MDLLEFEPNIYIEIQTSKPGFLKTQRYSRKIIGISKMPFRQSTTNIFDV